MKLVGKSKAVLPRQRDKQLMIERMTGVILPVDAGATVAAGSDLPKETSFK